MFYGHVMHQFVDICVIIRSGRSWANFRRGGAHCSVCFGPDAGICLGLLVPAASRPGTTTFIFIPQKWKLCIIHIDTFQD